MLYYTRTGETIVIPSTVCERAELGLAHDQMQRHLDCRIDRCAWKWVAHATLVHHGRVVPPLTGPHERAYRRGLALPVEATVTRAPNITEPQTFQKILDGLDRLARELRGQGDAP
ncbi:hypothetical protein [Nocardia vaccinii]|uniref:hypothetical protein n=1 Tax=Nocardia vaccinii TaxID=1822 RepID=UPI0008299E30|nr:hypothetical protein [Nocardia vaccinii]